MSMNYSSLIGPKGQAGSIANWVSYTRLDLTTIVDEAQALLYETLRVREMITEYRFQVPAGGSELPVPAGFLDPIGKIWSPTLNYPIEHIDEGRLQRERIYQTLDGSFGANPFTTTNGSSLVSVNLAGNGFNQGATITIAGAAAVNGLTPNGTFPIASLTDANNFVIDTSILGAQANAAGSGGGSAATYDCNNLTQMDLRYWAIWDEAIKFDGAAIEVTTGSLIYYRSLPLLATTNPTNFLTKRYPNLMRVACTTAAADFMKDSTEYQKNLTALTGLIQRINVENEGHRRGSTVYIETP